MKIDRKTPTYLKPDDVDSLARHNLQLMTELWITKDRLMMLENMLEKSGLLDRESLDSFVPTDDFDKEVQDERRAYLTRIMGANPDTRDIKSLSERALTKSPKA